MKKSLTVCLLLLCSGSVMAGNEVKQGLLVCNPINADRINNSTGIAVKWKDNSIVFLDDANYHNSQEKFIKEDGVWNSYCNDSYSGGIFTKNVCSSPGMVSLFTGRTLVRSRVEYRCRNVE